MADTGIGPKVVLVAGAITFTAEWYWDKQIDWKVPLATVLLAAGFEGLALIDKGGATILSLMVFAGAVTTKFNGHSAIDMLTNLTTTTGKLGSKNVTPVQ